MNQKNSKRSAENGANANLPERYAEILFLRGQVRRAELERLAMGLARLRIVGADIPETTAPDRPTHTPLLEMRRFSR
jgi:hypothetical protein